MVEQISDLQIYSEQKDYFLPRPVMFDSRKEGLKALFYSSDCYTRQLDPAINEEEMANTPEPYATYHKIIFALMSFL